MNGRRIVEENGSSFGRDPAVPVLIVQDPDLHVAGAVGVTDIDGIVEKHTREGAFLQHLLNPAEAVEAHPRDIDLRLGIVLRDPRGVAGKILTVCRRLEHCRTVPVT